MVLGQCMCPTSPKREQLPGSEAGLQYASTRSDHQSTVRDCLQSLSKYSRALWFSLSAVTERLNVMTGEDSKNILP